MKVYIVISKNDNYEYESYGCIEKIFINKEKAEQHKEKCERKNLFYSIYHEIEEMEVEK